MIYVLHYKKNETRKRYIEQHLDFRRLAYHLITSHDKEELKRNEFYSYCMKENFIAICSMAHVLVNNLIQLGRSTNSIFLSLLGEYPISNPALIHPLVTKMLCPGPISDSNLSLNLKHREAWFKLLKSDDQFAIVMEDDVIFKENSLRQIKKLITILPDDYDYIDIGGGSGLNANYCQQYIQDYRIPNIFRLIYPSTRTTCAYIIHRRLAQKLIACEIPILFPIDFQLTYLFNLFGSSIGWVEPSLVLHGSETGHYASSNERTYGYDISTAMV